MGQPLELRNLARRRDDCRFLKPQVLRTNVTSLGVVHADFRIHHRPSVAFGTGIRDQQGRAYPSRSPRFAQNDMPRPCSSSGAGLLPHARPKEPKPSRLTEDLGSVARSQGRQYRGVASMDAPRKPVLVIFECPTCKANCSARQIHTANSVFECGSRQRLSPTAPRCAILQAHCSLGRLPALLWDHAVPLQIPKVAGRGRLYWIFLVANGSHGPAVTRLFLLRALSSIFCGNRSLRS